MNESKWINVADVLAVTALALAGIASAAGLVIPGLYRDNEGWIRQARATDLITLLVAVPVLGLSLWFARRGSLTHRLVTIGSLAYLAYSYAIFAFSVVINPTTPLAIAILGLSVWALVLSILQLRTVDPDGAVSARLPRRVTGGFLVTVASLFALQWLLQIMSAISTRTLPTEVAKLDLPTNPIFALDLAFSLPFVAYAGFALLRRARGGAAMAVAALVWLVLIGLGVLAVFAFDYLAGQRVETFPVVLVTAITAAATLLAFLGIARARDGAVLASVAEDS